MLKNILNLNGAQEMSKNELQLISGSGGLACSPSNGCVGCRTLKDQACCENPIYCD